MKNRIFTIPMMLLLLGIGCTAVAQDDLFTISTGGSFGKPKIVPHLDKFGIAQLSVTYKLTSTESTLAKEKKTGKMAGAKLTAYLETTDGELTTDDFQEVTDYFYAYFQKQLKQNGIDTVAWSTIAATDFYKGADEKTLSNEQEKGSGQVWVTYNANKGNILYGGFTAFAFGKIKKASHFCEDIGAPAGFFYVTLDFADILVDLKISTSDPGYPSGYYPYTITTSYKYHSATKPIMKVIPSDANTLLWNEKQQGENVRLDKEIQSDAVYHTAVLQDPSRIKNRMFAFAKAMDPVVIETTRAQYKAAAKKALEKYVDGFLAKAKEMKKD